MIVISVDPAVGGGFAVVCADLSDRLVILDALTTYGLQRTEEQLSIIEGFVVKYRPSTVIIEVDAQQKALGNDERLRQMSQRYGFTIRPHLTKGMKMDMVFGVMSMERSFKAGEIRIPMGDKPSEDRMRDLITQLRAWRPPERGPNGTMKYTTKHLTQDLVMALWFCHLYWAQIRKQVTAVPAPAWRPSWASVGALG